MSIKIQKKLDKQCFPSTWFFGHIVRSFVNPTANFSDELPKICRSKPKNDSKREYLGIKILLKIFPSTCRMPCWHPRRKNFDQQLKTFRSSPKSIKKGVFWEQKSSQSNLWTPRMPVWQPCLKILDGGPNFFFIFENCFKNCPGKILFIKNILWTLIKQFWQPCLTILDSVGSMSEKISKLSRKNIVPQNQSLYT